MTDLDFASEQEKALRGVPVDFHGFLCEKAWDDAHGSGREAVIEALQDLVDRLKPSIDRYRGTFQN